MLLEILNFPKAGPLTIQLSFEAANARRIIYLQ